MSLHSYSRVWLHAVWGTLERRPLLTRAAAAKASEYLHQYSAEKGAYMKLNYVNPDHVHLLVDLPTNLSIEQMMHLFKGASSHWINRSNLLPCKFAWGRGYGVFSVSHSGVGQVAKYIAEQEEHHRKRTFTEEVRMLVERYGLKWYAEDETVENGFNNRSGLGTPRLSGVLMRAPATSIESRVLMRAERTEGRPALRWQGQDALARSRCWSPPDTARPNLTGVLFAACAAEAGR